MNFKKGFTTLVALILMALVFESWRHTQVIGQYEITLSSLAVFLWGLSAVLFSDSR